jgi:hypothetical protein
LRRFEYSGFCRLPQFLQQLRLPRRGLSIDKVIYGFVGRDFMAYRRRSWLLYLALFPRFDLTPDGDQVWAALTVEIRLRPGARSPVRMWAWSNAGAISDAIAAAAGA